MKCPMDGRDHAALLLDYVAGKLEAKAAANIETHMEACPACAEFARGQRAVWQALEEWESAPVPMGFDRNLYERIDRQVSWWDRVFTPVFRHAMPVAAAAAVMVFAGFMLQRPAGRVAIVSQESAQVAAMAPDQVAAALDDMQTLRDFNSLVHADNSAPRM